MPLLFAVCRLLQYNKNTIYEGAGLVDYLTVKEAGDKWGVGTRIVTQYCNEGRIGGAEKKGNLWLIPKDAPKPADKRRREYKSI
jgi:hypothetical protein